MKLKVELDLQSIKALADLGVEGMQDEINRYGDAFHRWVSNIDVISMYVGNVCDEHSTMNERKGLFELLDVIIEYIEPLFSDEQRKYIWASMEEKHIEDLAGIKQRCEFIKKDNFDISYYTSYLDYMETKSLKIVEDFNKVHRAKS